MNSSAARICPNVFTLNWVDNYADRKLNNETIEYLHLFLGPNTRRLRTSLFGADFGYMSLLRSLPGRFPGLTDVDLSYSPTYSDPPDQNTIGAISDSLWQWKELKYIRNCAIFPFALAHLALLPTLQKIHAKIYDHNDEWQQSLSRLPFHSLRELSVVVDHFSSCATIIELMEPQCRLSNVIVNSRDICEPRDLEHFIWTLKGCCSDLTLTTLHIGGFLRPPLLVPDLVIERESC